MVLLYDKFIAISSNIYRNGKKILYIYEYIDIKRTSQNLMNAQERLKFIKNYLGGISQKELSILTKVSIGTIAGIEKGQQKSFNYNLAVAINKTCKENSIKPFTISWMMSGEGEMFENPENTLERRTLNIDELLEKTDNIGKIFDFIRTTNNLSIEEFIAILDMTKERYLEICLKNVLPNMKEAILLKANFNIKIDDFLFDEHDEIKKMIGEKSEFNNKIAKLSPTQRAYLNKKLN